MRRNDMKQRLSIMKLLLIGGLILLVCIGVCIYMVSKLENSYISEAEIDYEERSVNAAAVISSLTGSAKEVVKAAADSLEGDGIASINDARILLTIRDYSSYEGFLDLVYISCDGYYYYNMHKKETSRIPNLQKDVLEAILNGKTEFSKIVQTQRDDTQAGLVTAVPVYINQTLHGYLTAYCDLTDLFEEQAFSNLRSLADCYILDEDGMILLGTNDFGRFSTQKNDFQLNVLEYMAKPERARQQLLLGMEQMKKGESGIISLATLQNDGMIIAYCPLNGIRDAYLVTCYRDNLVENRIHPLVINSVISCIVIVSLMVIVILFVWSSAKNANMTIEKLAYEDPVTKGHNLNFFKEFATNVLNVYKETPFVIHRFDIANFRYINEAYGHRKADEILKSCIRNFEAIFAENELCVRMNSDQFLALIVNDQTMNQRIAQYHSKINLDARSVGVKYPIRFKTGIYQCKKHESNIDVMIDHANVARKSLNGDEKEMTVVYSDRIITSMQKMNRIESDMQHALATNEFKIFLQPKWDIHKDSICGAEALVRWIKADGTMVYPNDFIPIFENNGFVEKLDFYMLEMVCQQLRMMMDAGRYVYPVSVNQSRLLMHSPDYVSNVQKILKKYKIPEGLIELEITETVFLDERDLMIGTMKQLKQSGVKLAMDDFGSGYSSLNMLKDIPFDIIKIDREFFSESVTSTSSQWIMQKIIEMCDGLGMEVICEGVETKEQVDLLRLLGCRQVQGFYYAKPMPINEFTGKYCFAINR